MDIKKRFIQIFESMIVAWIWLFLVVIHIFVISQIESDSSLVKTFDFIIYISCFLIYPYVYTAHLTVWPFMLQFVFWWFFGAGMIWLYRRLSRKHK